MKHNLKISVSRNHCNNGIVSCRSITVRERILRFLLGKEQRMNVLIPGDSVQEVAICEVKGGSCDE